MTKNKPSKASRFGFKFYICIQPDPKVKAIVFGFARGIESAYLIRDSYEGSYIIDSNGKKVE